MKFGKRFMALALALAAAMLTSVGAAQALAADAGAVAPYAAAAAVPQTNLAIANSVGLGANSNNLMGWKVGYADVYVNTYSGNFTYTNVLNEVNEDDYPEMEFRLTYNSQDPQDFGFGPGFRCNFNMQVVPVGPAPLGTNYAFVDQTGTTIVFDENDQATVDGVRYELRRYGNGYGFSVTTDKNEINFDEDGRFIYMLGGGLATSYRIEAEYDENGLLKSITPKASLSQGNRKIEFIHTATQTGVPAISEIQFYDRTGADAPSSTAYLEYSTYGLKKLYMGSDPRSTIEFSYYRGVVSEVSAGNNSASISYAGGTLGAAVASINLRNEGQYQYLYDRNQTVVTNPDGIMQLRDFNQDGVWINP